MTELTEHQAVLLRLHTHHGRYDMNHQSHPLGICSTDLTLLYKIDKAAKNGVELKVKDPRQKWSEKILNDIVIPDPESDNCQCPICHLGGFNPIGKKGNSTLKANPVMNISGGKIEGENETPKKKKVRILQ